MPKNDRAAHAALSDTAKLRKLDAIRDDLENTQRMLPVERAYRKTEAQVMRVDIGYVAQQALLRVSR